MNRVLQFLRDHRAALVPEPDGELLARFAETRDEAAFAQLVARHGGVVAGVCRRMLSNPADRDDAFQAVFVVLARKAGRLNGGRPLAPWLHKVAVWTAKSVRRSNARRARWQEPLTADRAAPSPDSLAADLDEALAALPERYRVPVVMCYLEGWTRPELAACLGCGERTLSERLRRGLDRLRARLGDAAPALLLSLGAAGTVPSATAHATAAAVAGSGLTVTVLTLSHEVLRMFWLPKLLTLTAGTAATVATGVAVVALAGPPGPGQPGTPTTAPVARAQASPPARADDKKPELPKPAEAEKPTGDFPELAEYERLEKLEAELLAEERRLGVRLARSEALQQNLAIILQRRQADDTAAIDQLNESYCIIRASKPAGGKPAYPVADIAEFLTVSTDPKDGPSNPRGGYHRRYQAIPGDRQELAAALTKAKVKRVWAEDRDFGPEERDEIFAGCKLAGVAEFYCLAPLAPAPAGHFAPPELIERLTVKPAGQEPYPFLIRLDLSKLDAKPGEAKGPPVGGEAKVDADYAQYQRLTKLVGDLRAEQARVAGRLQRVYSKRGQFFGSLLRQRDNQIESLQGDRVCVVQRGFPPNDSVVAANVRRHQPVPPGTIGASPGPNSYQITVERIDYYDRRDLAAELMKAKVVRLIVSQHHTTAVGFDELTEILAAAKAAKVAEVYVPKPLQSSDSDAPTRELLAKYGMKPAADTPLVVRLDLANYTPPAAAKP